MRYTILTVICVLLYVSNAAGQQFIARHYGVQDGLPHATVYRIYKDGKGILWFCTEGGLCSFDGHTFNNMLPLDDSFLRSSPISVSEDEQGNKIMCSYNDGLYILSDTLTAKYGPDGKNWPKFCFYAVSTNGVIRMVGRNTEDALYKIENKTISKEQLTDNSGKNVLVKKIVKLGNSIFIITSDGLYTISNNEVKPFMRKLIKGNVTALQINRHGQYVIALQNKVLVADTAHIIEEYNTAPGSNNMVMACDSRDNIWVLVYGRKMLLLKQGQIQDIGKCMPVQNLYINDMAEDIEGNMWIATYNEGLYMIPSTDILRYPANDKNTNRHYHHIEPTDSTSMLVCGVGSVSVFRDGRMESVKVRSLAHDEYVYFAKQTKEYTYIGTPTRLIRKSMVYPYKEDMPDLGKNSGAICIYRDSQKRIWIGGFNDLHMMEGDKVVQVSYDTMLTNKRYNAISEDSKGNFWFATNTGLICSDGKKCKWVVHFPSGNFSYIYGVYEDSRGRIWAPSNVGLICAENGKCRIYEKKDGLLSTRCLTVCEDKNNLIWIGTPKGLNYIKPGDTQIKVYYAGTNTEEVLSLYAWGNRLFAGTSDNLLSINTDRANENAVPPPVYINSVSIKKRLINSPVNIAIPYNENKVIIDFTAISYRHPAKVEYRYKVKGLDDNWRVTTNHSIELAALPPGGYEFVLSARIGTGNWSNNVALPITVSTPFWKKNSFILFTVCGLIYIIYEVSKRRTERKEFKKREKLLQLNKIAYLKQQALAALINPHFIFNCMNSIQHFLNRKDNEKANGYLADFANLIRLTMEQAQEMFIVLNDEVHRLQIYLSLEQLRFGEGLTWYIHVDNRIKEETILIPNMIVQPYVENAIWHGIMPQEGNGAISVSFMLHGSDELKITIEDNGIGIMQGKSNTADGNKKHYGMSLTADRLQLLKQISGQPYSVHIEELVHNGVVCGTKVEITVAVKPPDLEKDSTR